MLTRKRVSVLFRPPYGGRLRKTQHPDDPMPLPGHNRAPRDHRGLTPRPAATARPSLGSGRRPRPRAFTLLEILIVVVLLGVLAAMVMPRFVDATSQVEEAAIRNQLTEVRKQLRYYNFKQNAYPPDLETLVASGYIDKVPMHPSPGNYNYNPKTGAITSSRDAAW